MSQSAAACTHCIVQNGTVANELVDKTFFDCLYCTNDWVGFAFQLVSICFWIVTQVPQFIDNWKNGSADALSPIFLADWLLGDSCNLVGCLLTGTQLPLTTGTAWYFVGCDIIMIIQYVYYAASSARKGRMRSQQRKRQLIQAAAAAGEQGLLEYSTCSEEVDIYATTVTARFRTVHSAPSTFQPDMSDTLESTHVPDRGWHVHAIEPALLAQLPRQVLPAAPEEVSTSHEPVLVLHVPSSQPDPSVASAQPALPTRLIRLIVFGISLAATLAAVMLWILQSGNSGAIPSSAKGLMTTLYSDWQCVGSSAGPAGCMQAQVGAIEHGSLPLCPEKQLPAWTRRHVPLLDCISCVSGLRNRLGLAIGYVSVVAYLKSRVAQLLRNFARGHADGLSASMFVCAISANVTGSTGIFLRLKSRSELIWQLPWLIGGRRDHLCCLKHFGARNGAQSTWGQLGTAGMDVLIAMQAAQSAKHPQDESESCQQQLQTSPVEDCPLDAPECAVHAPVLPQTSEDSIDVQGTHALQEESHNKPSGHWKAVA